MANKIGRNDPCWCGSGKKYKKCHEAFDTRLEQFRQDRAIELDTTILGFRYFG